MVLLSDPDAIRALYAGNEHGLPPGRTIALRPIMGDRSILLLEGREHLERRRLMLPPFHGERMLPLLRGSRSRAIARRRGRSLAARGALRTPAPHAGDHLRGDSPDRLRRHSEPARLDRLRALAAGRLLDETASPRVSASACCSPPAASAARTRSASVSPPPARAEIDELLLADIADRRASESGSITGAESARAATCSGCPARGPLRGRQRDRATGSCATRSSRCCWPAMRRPRRHSRGPSICSCARRSRSRACARSCAREAMPTCGPSSRSRCGCGRCCRSRAAGSHTNCTLRGRASTLPAGTDVTHRRSWLTYTRADLYPQSATQFLPGALPRPSRRRRTPGFLFGGGVRRCLGAAFAELPRCAVVLASRAHRNGSSSSPQDAIAPKAVARRNITFAPRHGTRVRARAITSAPRIGRALVGSSVAERAPLPVPATTRARRRSSPRRGELREHAPAAPPHRVCATSRAPSSRRRRAAAVNRALARPGTSPTSRLRQIDSGVALAPASPDPNASTAAGASRDGARAPATRR